MLFMVGPLPLGIIGGALAGHRVATLVTCILQEKFKLVFASTTLQVPFITEAKNPHPLAQMTNNDSVEFLFAMDIFWILIVDFDSEGRSLFLNAIANQIRNPNNYTHFFSYVLLYLFVNANKEIIQEQITRVLLEGLIVNRPHPWRLLITFIELIKNPKYNFWCRSFTRCAP
ncbi:CCR4-NOT transcription complex subunit 1-like [Camellia sinensis]|uniref:CCR4-NOT transcription complex subunit 1-like n=1 Tax=Camellia sinensis TaxID=4442 RepID=UPI0010362949|nr:CCR4-NOT transcription complex subunit 1-like [Camellia sinensis]